MMDHHLQSIVITGASSGLGAGLARSYAKPGVRLALIGRDAARLEMTAEACRSKGATVVCGLFDIGDPDAFGDWLLEQDRLAPVDLVAACAGVSAGTPSSGGPEGLALATIQLRANLSGTFHTVEPLLPAMIERRRGHIAVVSSIAGLRGLPYSPAYSASKAGVRAYGEALRGLLAPFGIAVTVIVPGFFDTPMTDRFDGPKPFLLSLDKTVRIVRHGLDRRRRRIIFPRLLALGTIAADLMPAIFGDAIMRSFRFHIRPGR